MNKQNANASKRVGSHCECDVEPNSLFFSLNSCDTHNGQYFSIDANLYRIACVYYDYDWVWYEMLPFVVSYGNSLANMFYSFSISFVMSHRSETAIKMTNASVQCTNRSKTVFVRCRSRSRDCFDIKFLCGFVWTLWKLIYRINGTNIGQPKRDEYWKRWPSVPHTIHAIMRIEDRNEARQPFSIHINHRHDDDIVVSILFLLFFCGERRMHWSAL